MLKTEELTDPKSCMSRAKNDEMTFVLLGRDSCAPLAIRAWVEGHVACGKNKRDDPQITEALSCAAYMEAMLSAAPPNGEGKGKPTLTYPPEPHSWVAIKGDKATVVVEKAAYDDLRARFVALRKKT